MAASTTKGGAGLKHHFGDLLDRDGDYWTIVPNVERYAYSVGNVPAGSKEIKVATISKGDEHWERIFTFPNLEELTLHEPDQQQLSTISRLTSLTRLRITHARSKELHFLAPLVNVRELVLEYFSGFSDLAPLRSLTALRSLHMENLRGVSDFGGLAGMDSLRYLRIDGTLDWKQPMSDFHFLKGLPNLEVLSFGFVINKLAFPALLPVLSLKKLKTLKIGRATFSTDEYALLEVGLPNVNGARWEPTWRTAYRSMPLPKDDIRSRMPAELIRANHPDIHIWHDGQRMMDDPDSYAYEFLGKGARGIACSSAQAETKRSEFDRQYDVLKENARKLLDSTSGL
jgi:hypothetical protein